MAKFVLLVLCSLLIFYIDLQAQSRNVGSSNLKNPKVQVRTSADSGDFNGAQWIGDSRPLPVPDSLCYGDQPAPRFRKVFSVSRLDVKKVTLYITAAGYWQALLNGKQIGFTSLEPAWTDFSKRIYYSAYDLTPLIQQGNNCLAVALGNGFYNPLPLRMFGTINLQKNLHTGKPCFIARLLIEYKEGSSQQILSNSSWKHAEGPLRRNNVYLGVRYDARYETKGWDQPTFNDQGWLAAKSLEGPAGQFIQAFFPPIRVTDQLKAKAVLEPDKGVYVVDMGSNFAGSYHIRLKGSAGDTIVFRFGERCYPNGVLDPMTTVCGQIKRKGAGGPGAPDIAWQTDTYIFGKDSVVEFSPKFIFHGFRYMEIRGLKQRPQPEEITGLAMNSDVAQDSHFVCSSPLLNKIQQISLRTFRANLFSVQSDCPAREKFGYGGDLNAVGESFIYNFDMHSFYRKTVYDWADAINDSVFVDTAPNIGLSYCGISWESAFLITQYRLWLYYHEVDLIKEMYSRDVKWMEKLKRIHPEGIVDKGLSDHEALIPSLVQLTGTLHYLQCARIMEQFSKLMKDVANEQKFRELALDLAKKIKQRFWDLPADTAFNQQSLFAGLLTSGILSGQEAQKATAGLAAAIRKGEAGHLMTGIFGTHYVMNAAAEKELAQQLFDVVNSTAFPGWGYMVDHGATTLWETWKESDNVYSNCHPMFGSVSEWFYRCLAGIRPDPADPGFHHFILAPFLPQGLDSVNCTYRSPFGTIVSNWKKLGQKVYFELQVPLHSTATFRPSITFAGRAFIEKVSNSKSVSRETIQTSKLDLRLTAGRYRITLTPF